MPVVRPGRLLKCAAAVLLACVVLATMQCKRAEEKPSGEALARRYCSGCHEFPDPSVLTKESWRFLLTYMGFYLGQNNFDVLKGSSRSVIENIRSKQMTLQVSGLIPSEPVVSDADWAAIRRYYDSLAPATALPQTGKPMLTDKLALFKMKETVYQPREAIVTMVRVDEPHRQIVVANARDLDLVMLDKQLQVTQKYNGYELLVDMFEHDDSLYVLSIGDLMGRYVGMDRGYVLKVPRNNAARANALPAAGGLWRPADMAFTDLDSDGVNELVVCNFGDVDGSLQLFTLQHGTYKLHSTIVQAPGIVKLCVQDFNKDGLPDLAVLMSHARENISLMINKGNLAFERKTVVETGPAYGHTYFELQDFNNDGHMDLLVSNGDSDADPYNTLKNYHGVRIYMNDGRDNFSQKYFYPMYGVHFAKAADFDNDGDLDIAAVAFFPDFRQAHRENFAYLENDGRMTFAAATDSATFDGRWMVMDVGDYDGDGDKDIVLGAGYLPLGMTVYHEDLYQSMLKDGKALIVMENQTQ